MLVTDQASKENPGDDRWRRERSPERGERYQLRAATSEECETVANLLIEAFGGPPLDDKIELERRVFEPERNHVIVTEGRIVANIGAYTRDITVPGSVLPAAHVSLAVVRAEHRRRGLLTRLIHHQFQSMPEPLAVLWASEGSIYQRFGYGMAAGNARMEVDTREVRLAPFAPAPGGEIRDAAPAEARECLIELYDRVRIDRPGWSGRDERWWDVVLSDLAGLRFGASRKRLTLFEGENGTEGYAIWRIKSGRETGERYGEAQVLEAVATTPEAYAGLWRHLLSIDLTRRTTISYAAVDEPLRYLVTEPRSLHCGVSDGLWLRLVDVGVALAGRRYAAPLDLVLEITDELLPANDGRYRLRAEPGELAICDRTAAAPDLSCDVSALAAAYLGGVSLASLAAGGRVRERVPGALGVASAAFGWYRAPSPSEMF